MGVHGLWELLAPVGRRVSVETLSGKKLAVDASIWMVQFMKAMRDEKGEMVRNAHILGFFRRICKLLYLRTKPVFVFDGGTPSLKRRTVIARRRQRENAQAKVRKTAEKLLLNQLKSMRLKELARDIENQRKMNKSDARHKASNVDKVVLDHRYKPMSNGERDGTISEGYQNKNVGEMEIGSSKNSVAASNKVFSSFAEEECEEEEELILESSNQDDKCKKKAKGKEVLADEADIGSHGLEGDDVVSNSYDQEKLDEMLAASLAAQENGSLFNTPSTVTAPVTFGEDSGDEDEEMILPLHGKVDPSILAALPPSVQLDLLVQMRERLMAENRQRYQKVKKAPERFSELQIQAYLKTVAFRREIDEVQKAASGKVVDGVQTSRIASEANREFIFSSSFSGDKQSLAAPGVQRNEDKQQQRPNGQLPLKSADNISSFSKPNSGKEFTPDQSGSGFHDGIETFLDERGRTRVSRVRAMGMRMTRDLQRNLDLMKEIEGEQTYATKSATEDFPIENRPVKSSQDKNTDGQPMLSNDTSVQISFEVGNSRCIDSDDDIFTRLALGGSIGLSSAGNNVAKSQISGSASDSDWEEGIEGEQTHATKPATEDFPIENQPVKSSQDKNVEVVTDGQPMLLSNDTSMKISFEVDNSRCIDSDDDIFTRLALGDSMGLSSVGNNVAKSPISGSASDSDWEEGIVNGNGDVSSGNVVEINPSLEATNIRKDSALQWGEGVCDDPKSFVYKAEFEKPVSKGCMEEEADLQEAIRRSLNDLVSVKVKASGAEITSDSVIFLDQGNTSNLDISGDDYVQHLRLSDASDVKKLDDVGGIDKKGMPMSRLLKRDSDFGDATTQDENPDSELLPTKSVTNLGEESTHLVVEHCSSSLNNDRGKFTLSSEFSGPLSSGILSSKMVDDRRSDNETMPEFSPHSVKMREPSLSFTEPSLNSLRNNDIGHGLAEEENFNNELGEIEHYMDKAAVTSCENMQANSVGTDLEEEMQANSVGTDLEEEMQCLDKEYKSLGEEQRKLERNADSVTGEMFTECQELLQIFGLPYIIAPMEAEAQCAYMELANLVDGVVTDDCDAFLFGARNVYKNIFDDRKYVETYFMKDIEKELGLTREKLIRMALLLGSDYTEGVSGIGIVNAIEVVNAFPEEDGLHKFREWIESPDPTILGVLGAPDGPSSRKRGPKFDGGKDTKKNAEETHTQGNDISDICQEEKSSGDIPEIKQIFMDKHRNVSKNWHIPSSFPSETVISAYLCPQVDKSTEPFSWGKPDLHVLHRLCWEKFGWGMQKSNELLQPVLKEYNKHETQLRLEAFYTFNERFAKIRSKRIKKAVKGITGNLSKELIDNVVEEASESRKKRKVGCGQSFDCESEKPSESINEIVIGVKSCVCEKSIKKTTSQVRISADKGKKELQANTGPGPYNRSQGSKRVRDSGGGSRTGRGIEKKRTSSERSDCSSDDVSGGNFLEEVCVDMSDLQGQRRSTRLRKPACYVESDLEIYDADKSVEKGISDEEEVEPGLSSLPRASKNSHIGLKKNDKHEVDDLSFEISFEDRVENQGGFCPDEGEVGHTCLRENISPMEADVSKDYLKMGGGFCAEETEAEKDDTCGLQTNDVSNACPSGFIEEVQHEAGTCSFKGASNELQQDGGHNSCSKTKKSSEFVDAAHVADSSKVCVSRPESNENTLETPSLGGLRAMPALKRKRRKS